MTKTMFAFFKMQKKQLLAKAIKYGEIYARKSGNGDNTGLVVPFQ